MRALACVHVSPDLAAVERACTQHFGHSPTRASISFLGVEPIEVLRYEAAPGEWAYVTLGMSRRPMTPATADVLATSGPRAELLLQVRRSVESGGDSLADVWRQLAVLAAAPAVEGVVYTPGMTVDLGAPLAPGSRCTGGLIAESGVPPVPTDAGVTQILSVLPATPTELAWCRVHGAEALRERWREQETDLLDLVRAAARLG